MASDSGRDSTGMCSTASQNESPRMEFWREERRTSSKSASTSTSDEEDDGDSQLDGMSFDSNDRVLAEEMMLEFEHKNATRDSNNHGVPKASDILVYLPSLSGYTISKISAAAPREDDDGEADQSHLKNTTIKKNLSDIRKNSFPLPHVSSLASKYDSLEKGRLTMKTSLPTEHTTTNISIREENGIQLGKTSQIHINDNGDIAHGVACASTSSTSPANDYALEKQPEDNNAPKIMAQGGNNLINNAKTAHHFKSNPAAVTDAVRKQSQDVGSIAAARPQDAGASTDVPMSKQQQDSNAEKITMAEPAESVLPCINNNFTTSAGTAMNQMQGGNTWKITACDASLSDESRIMHQYNRNIRKRPHKSIARAAVASTTTSIDKAEAMHQRKRKIDAITTDSVTKLPQYATAGKVVSSHSKLTGSAIAGLQWNTDNNKMLLLQCNLEKYRTHENNVVKDKDQSSHSSPSSVRAKADENSNDCDESVRKDDNSVTATANAGKQLTNKKFASVNDTLCGIDKNDTRDSNKTRTLTAAATTIITPNNIVSISIDQSQRNPRSAKPFLPLIGVPVYGSNKNNAKNFFSKQKTEKQKGRIFRTVEPTISAVAGRTKLLLPKTRSTDVPNGVINLTSPERCPRLYKNSDPPITLATEIYPQERHRVNNMLLTDANQYVTCYDRKTCKVLENVCEATHLAELLAGHAELEPIIPPSRNQQYQQKNMQKGNNYDDCCTRQGRSSSSIRVLSTIRPQNSMLRCSEIHVGKVVQVIDGIYSGQQGTISTALPTGWYTVSGLAEQEDIDIYIKASNVKLVTDPGDDISCLQGMDTSLLQQLGDKKSF
jgi:hypothetical protein